MDEMLNSAAEPSERTADHSRIHAVVGAYAGFCLVMVILISLYISRTQEVKSVFLLHNFVGDTAQNLLTGHGYTAPLMTRDATGQVVPVQFRAHRMPAPSLLVTLLILIFGDKPATIRLVKSVLLVLPILPCIYLVLRSRSCSLSLRSQLIALSLLMIPFLIPAFLINTVNLHVEEGYLYSILALAFGLVLYRQDPPHRLAPIVFTLCLAGLYLTKSSAILICLWLLALYFQRHRNPKVRGLVVGVFLLSTALWIGRVYVATGRFAIGASVDAANFHKGNSSIAFQYYPPAEGKSLDQYDDQLDGGRHFTGEWDYSDYHKAQGTLFVRQHPGEALQLIWRKWVVMFLSLQHIGGGVEHGFMKLIETLGLLLFRIAFWTAFIGSLFCLRSKQPEEKFMGIAFLGLTATLSLPFLMGFAFTRHISILIYPSFMMLTFLYVGRQRENHLANRSKFNEFVHKG